MNKLIACLILLGFASCQNRYDGEKRILLDLHVTDKQGNPLRDKHFEMAAESPNQSAYSNNDVISYGLTDANGNVRLVFPVRESESDYALYFTGDDEFTETSISQIQDFECPDYKVPVSELTLYRANELVTLSLNPIPVSGSELKWITIEGPHSGRVPFGTPNYNTNYYYDTNFLVAKNSTIIIRFATSIGAAVTQHEQTVEIFSDNLSLDLNF